MSFISSTSKYGIVTVTVGKELFHKKPKITFFEHSGKVNKDANYIVVIWN